MMRPLVPALRFGVVAGNWTLDVICSQILPTSPFISTALAVGLYLQSHGQFSGADWPCWCCMGIRPFRAQPGPWIFSPRTCSLEIAASAQFIALRGVEPLIVQACRSKDHEGADFKRGEGKLDAFRRQSSSFGWRNGQRCLIPPLALSL